MSIFGILAPFVDAVICAACIYEGEFTLAAIFAVMAALALADLDNELKKIGR